MSATFSDLLLRVAFAFILSAVFRSPLGIWLAWPIGWTIATVISTVCYRRVKWDKAVSCGVAEP